MATVSVMKSFVKRHRDTILSVASWLCIITAVIAGLTVINWLVFVWGIPYNIAFAVCLFAMALVLVTAIDSYRNADKYDYENDDDDVAIIVATKETENK